MLAQIDWRNNDQYSPRDLVIIAQIFRSPTKRCRGLHIIDADVFLAYRLQLLSHFQLSLSHALSSIASLGGFFYALLIGRGELAILNGTSRTCSSRHRHLLSHYACESDDTLMQDFNGFEVWYAANVRVFACNSHLWFICRILHQA